MTPSFFQHLSRTYLASSGRPSSQQSVSQPVTLDVPTLCSQCLWPASIHADASVAVVTYFFFRHRLRVVWDATWLRIASRTRSSSSNIPCLSVFNPLGGQTDLTANSYLAWSDLKGAKQWLCGSSEKPFRPRSVQPMSRKPKVFQMDMGHASQRLLAFRAGLSLWLKVRDRASDWKSSAISRLASQYGVTSEIFCSSS